ncbi:MAG: MFS transporter [Candidatus Pacebacteria bacterium]|jgi:MFS family permease|nr:MFS transporter [Candidatus Paceibacterota bacterium]MBT3511892.1 MFS transporter [Candidatus Paceibacterota bacterium]MBT4005376.1 MFS transporter [Candidatus Paceibacterota bacterium]MBT4359308.1 MFS transporter [Candidatus Paceibacterota bacterium]MBT4681320.1 MFS transporter [Candidatus Paceibacterota bacterium]
MPRTRGYNLHLPSIHVNKSKNTNMLYGVRVFRDLVSKLAIFFLPIYLYQHGSSDPFWKFLPGSELQKGVLLLALFFLVHRITILLTGIGIGRLITRIGYRKSMLIGFILFAIFLSLLYIKENPGWLLLLASFVNGLETNFFWNSYNTLISKFTLKRHMGKDLGLLNFFLQLGQAITPALGGLLIVSFGFQSLFLVGLVGIMICIIFVLQLHLKKERDTISWKEFFVWTKEKAFLRLALSQAGRYINDATLIFWPLYIFLILGAIDRVGFLYTLSLFLAMIVSFGVGFYIDSNKNKKPFYVSGGILSIIWILRSQVISFWQIAIIDTFDKLSANFYAVYYDAIAIKRGKGSQALSYFVYRELIVSILAIPFWTVVGGLFLVFPDPWLALFMLASIGVLMGLLVKEHHLS